MAMDYALVQRVIDGTGMILDTTPGNPDTGSYVTEAQILEYVKGKILFDGYLYNGVFYKESGHLNIIPKVEGALYVDRSDPSNLALYICLSSTYTALTEEAQVQAIIDGLNDGTIVPLKAKQDQNGNVIDTTYETKTDANDLKNALSNTAVGFLDSQTAELRWTSHENSAIDGTTGELIDAPSFNCTEYVIIAPYNSIVYKRVKSTGYSTVGMAFYNSKYEKILAYNAVNLASDLVAVDHRVDVPTGAVYARFTYRKDTTSYGDFSVVGDIKLKATVDSINDEIGATRHQSKNIADPSEFSDGVLKKDGTVESGSAKYTDFIKVERAEIIRFYYSANLTSVVPVNFSCICAYDASKNVVSSAGINDNNVATSYTVPEGISYIRATFASVYASKIMISKEEVTTYEAYYTPYSTYAHDILTETTKLQINNNTSRISAIESDIGINRGFELHSEVSTLADSESLKITPAPNTSVNAVYSFETDISTFSKVVFGRDATKSYASFIEIDNTNIAFCINVGGTISRSTYAHGLTIANHLSCIIAVGNKKDETKVTITSDTGVYTATINFNGSNGDVVLVSDGSSLSNVSIKMSSSRWSNKFQLYWDSYEDFVGKHMVDNNAILLFDAYPGRTSNGGKNSFDKMMTLSKPSIVVWGLGMNDGDTSSAINSDWLTVAQYIEGSCDSNDIELIYLTVPNTPSVRNTFKNSYIKSSGRKYIDVANAVGASEAGSSWYTGLLSSDNVHPSTMGSKVIANTICSQLPEIIGQR